MKELDFVKTTQRGDKGKLVRTAQEWLCLQGSSLVIDGSYGPATELAVRGFQKKAKQPESGQVDQACWDALVSPMREVLQPIAAGSKSVRQLVVAYAERHLARHPMEAGGENSGPWVRLYMDGNEGPPWPWCAGFVTFILRQACGSRGAEPLLPRAFGCDFLAGVAQSKGIFLRPKNAGDFAKVEPGTFFLVRKNDFHWQHIGIVAKVEGDAMTTIEGNTNDSGVPEGFEVCRRSRGLKERDFLLV